MTYKINERESIEYWCKISHKQAMNKAEIFRRK